MVDFLPTIGGGSNELVLSISHYKQHTYKWYVLFMFPCSLLLLTSSGIIPFFCIY